MDFPNFSGGNDRFCDRARRFDMLHLTLRNNVDRCTKRGAQIDRIAVRESSELHISSDRMTMHENSFQMHFRAGHDGTDVVLHSVDRFFFLFRSRDYAYLRMTDCFSVR